MVRRVVVESVYDFRHHYQYHQPPPTRKTPTMNDKNEWEPERKSKRKNESNETNEKCKRRTKVFNDILCSFCTCLLENVVSYIGILCSLVVSPYCPYCLTTKLAIICFIYFSFIFTNLILYIFQFISVVCLCHLPLFLIWIVANFIAISHIFRFSVLYGHKMPTWNMKNHSFSSNCMSYWPFLFPSVYLHSIKCLGSQSYCKTAVRCSHPLWTLNFKMD